MVKKFFSYLSQRIKSTNFMGLCLDTCLILASFVFGLWLRVDTDLFVHYADTLFVYLPWVVSIKLGLLYVFGFYQRLYRYTTLDDVWSLCRVILLATGMILSLSYFMKLERLPRSLFLIDFFILSVALVSVRVLRRKQYRLTKNTKAEAVGKTPVIIWGAGTLAEYFVTVKDQIISLNFDIVGLIDDDRSKWGKRIHGFRVLGGTQSFESFIYKYKPQKLLVAIQDPRRDLLGEILTLCHQHDIEILKVSFDDLVNPHSQGAGVRSIELSDLLMRPPNKIDLTEVKQKLLGSVVLVTGAGGSIGSELCRQILLAKPEKLLLLDHSEYHLYQIDRELQEHSKSCEVISLLCDVTHSEFLTQVFHKYLPDFVYHAAAYKHVHLAEANPEATRNNNIKGTESVLRACHESSVSEFTLISTDKAVNPGGVMGQSKRECELLTQEFDSRKTTDIRHTIVRFGNVLGSSGSLIPLLTDKIQNNQPLTITDKRMTRYFMLIPEAVSLVLKSAHVSESGQISVLKMGEPIKIVDVAKKLRTLHGKTEKECPIVYTGIRPGEKLFEELYLSGQEIPTEHEQILLLPKENSTSQSHSPLKSDKKMGLNS